MTDDFARSAARTSPWLAAAVAALVLAPNVAWETAHGWPTVEFAKNAMEGKYKEHTLASFLGGVADIMSPSSLPLFMVGALAPFAMRTLRPWRPLACIPLVTFLILAASKAAKAEYLAASFPVAFAVAGVALEIWLRAWPRGRWALLVPVVGRAALSIPFVVPILSIDRFLAYQAALGAKPDSSEKKDMGPLPQLYADMFGWNELVDAVAVAAATLTPEERAHAGVLSRFYLWGPREADGSVMILMGGEETWAKERFESVVAVTSFDCPLSMPYERHKTIFVARGMKQPLEEFWRDRRYFE